MQYLHNTTNDEQKTKKAARFVSWLRRKELTTYQFSIETGVCASTIDKWRRGCSPRNALRRMVIEKYKDFPL